MEIKNIIVPIDFSEESFKGLDLAALFTQKIYCNIQMVYVIGKTQEHMPNNLDAIESQTNQAFETILQDYAPKLGNDSKLRYIIKRGRIYEEVVNQAQSYKDSIITASTHGASGFEELFIGSHAYKIISATDRPVITLRKGKCPGKIGKIVMPIDLSDDTRQKVPFTTELAQIFEAEIHAVAINTSKDPRMVNKLKSYLSQVSGFLSGKVAYRSEELFGDSPSEMVVDYATSIGADLVSIMTDQSTMIDLILGNTAHQIINKSDVPVLSITPKEIRIQTSSFRTFGG